MFIPLHDANGLQHIKLQYVTLAIITANIFIWLIMGTPAISDAEAVQEAYFAYGFIPAVANDLLELPANVVVVPSSLNYLTYAFFHGDFMHLAGNMLFLWVFGDNVEDAMGHVKYLAFYLLCAIAGAWFHAFMAPSSEAPLIGASAAAAGIVAAYLMLHPNVRVWVLALGRIPLRIPAFYAIGAWILFQIYNLIANPGDEVSWAAHVGGIVAGAALLPFFKRSDVPLFDWGEEAATEDKTSSDGAPTQQSSEMKRPSVQPKTAAPEVTPDQDEKPVGKNPKSSVPSVNRWGRQ